LLVRLGPEAKVLAGGQSLVPLLNLRLARRAHLVDINNLAERGDIHPLELRSEDLCHGQQIEGGRLTDPFR